MNKHSERNELDNVVQNATLQRWCELSRNKNSLGALLLVGLFVGLLSGCWRWLDDHGLEGPLPDEYSFHVEIPGVGEWEEPVVASGVVSRRRTPRGPGCVPGEVVDVGYGPGWFVVSFADQGVELLDPGNVGAYDGSSVHAESVEVTEVQEGGVAFTLFGLVACPTSDSEACEPFGIGEATVTVDGPPKPPSDAPTTPSRFFVHADSGVPLCVQ